MAGFLESISSFGTSSINKGRELGAGFAQDAGAAGTRFLSNIGEATGITQNAGAMEGLSKLGEITGLSGVLDRLGFDIKAGGLPYLQESQLPTLAKIDKRIKIKISGEYLTGSVLEPLTRTGNSIVFPYTPQIVLQSRANYNAVQPTHSNYAFQSYQNSNLDAISIVGTFTAQNRGEAEFVLATVHALRTITKMHFGSGKHLGAPPPVVLLDGYGDYMFNNMPVVISSFFFTMNDDVDYIDLPSSGGSKTSVPTRTDITVECLPAFARTDQASFNLEKFATGELTKQKGML